MKAKELILRCFVKQDGNQWVAVCIDLCLAAQADSLSDAKTKLESMVHSYLEDAFGRDNQYADQLLSRKAPLSQVMYYHWLKLKMKLMPNVTVSRKQVCRNSEIAFSEVMPLKLAL